MVINKYLIFDIFKRLFFKILITCHLQQTPTGAGGGRGLGCSASGAVD